MALKDIVRKSWMHGLGFYAPNAAADLAVSRSQALKYSQMGILPKDTLVLNRESFNTLNAQAPNKKKKKHSSAGKKNNPRFGAF